MANIFAVEIFKSVSWQQRISYFDLHSKIFSRDIQSTLAYFKAYLQIWSYYVTPVARSQWLKPASNGTAYFSKLFMNWKWLSVPNLLQTINQYQYYQICAKCVIWKQIHEKCEWVITDSGPTFSNGYRQPLTTGCSTRSIWCQDGQNILTSLCSLGSHLCKP